MNEQSHFSVFICGFVCMYVCVCLKKNCTAVNALQNDQLQFHTCVVSMTLITLWFSRVILLRDSTAVRRVENGSVCVFGHVFLSASVQCYAGLSALGLSLPTDMWWLGVGSRWHDRPVQRDWAERCRLRVNRAAFIFTSSWAWEKAAAQPNSLLMAKAKWIHR